MVPLSERALLAQLSIVLGHTNIQQTMRYARLATADLHEQLRLVEQVRNAQATQRAKNVHSVIVFRSREILLFTLQKGLQA